MIGLFFLSLVGMAGGFQEHLMKLIEKRVVDLNETLQATKSCSEDPVYYKEELCNDRDWQEREEMWRRRVLESERSRALTHARLENNFYLARNTDENLREAKTPWHVTLDFFEPEYSCCSEIRVPATIGDGPKWVCGAEHFHPKKDCNVLSLGSNFDDQFERGIFDITNCTSYIVDPTLHDKKPLPWFLNKLSTYGARLNTSVGITGDNPNQTLNHRRVIPIGQLIEGNGLGPHIDFLKADIEGAEYNMMNDIKSMCEKGTIAIDHLNLEVHVWHRHTIDLVNLFDAAYHCQLMLFHKERNAWGCEGFYCAEFSWVSFQRARDIHHQCTVEPII